jgi:hypothetical protein
MSVVTSEADIDRRVRDVGDVPQAAVSKCSKWQQETAPGYPAEKAHARFARDQLRSA